MFYLSNLFDSVNPKYKRSIQNNILYMFRYFNVFNRSIIIVPILIPMIMEYDCWQYFFNDLSTIFNSIILLINRLMENGINTYRLILLIEFIIKSYNPDNISNAVALTPGTIVPIASSIPAYINSKISIQLF